MSELSLRFLPHELRLRIAQILRQDAEFKLQRLVNAWEKNDAAVVFNTWNGHDATTNFLNKVYRLGKIIDFMKCFLVNGADRHHFALHGKQCIEASESEHGLQGNHFNINNWFIHGCFQYFER